MTFFKGVHKVGLLVACLLLTNACQQSPVRNPFEGRKEVKLGTLPTVSEGKSPHMQVAWTNKAVSKQDLYLKLTPHVTGNEIYVADSKGNLSALEKETGKTLWHRKTGQKYIAGPMVSDNLVLVSTNKATILAFDKSNGNLRWQAKVPSRIAAPANGADGVVLVHTIDGTISAFNAQNGESLWQVEQSTPSLSLHFGSMPVVSGKTVITGLSNGKVVAINLHNGMIEWERALAVPRGRSELQRMVDIVADPIVIGQTVYAINYQGKLAALNVMTGEMMWERELSSYQNMISSEKALYLTDTDHNLWAIDRHNGMTLWKQNALKERYITGPALVNDVLAVADREGYLHFVNQENGQLLGREKINGKIVQMPTAFADKLLVSTNKGKLTALRVAREYS